MDLARFFPSRFHAAALLYGILFLFFFQLIADFVEGIYAFGLLGTSIPNEIAAVLLLFSPLLLLAVRDELSRRWTAGLAALVVVSRLVEVMLDTRGRMILSGVGVGAFLVLLPALLWHESRRGEGSSRHAFGAGLLLALSLSILLRALHSGSDLSMIGRFQWIAWVMALLTGGAWLQMSEEESPETPTSAGVPARRGRVTGFSLGLMGTLTLLYFAFTSPHVIARWTGVAYLPVLAVTVFALALFTAAMADGWLRPPLLTRGRFLMWNLLFLLALTGAILAHQINFPTDPAAYPLPEPAVPAWASGALFLMLLLHPILLLDFAQMAEGLMAERPGMRALGGSFALASLFVLVLILSQVFTTTYAYIPVVGPSFRDKFWLVFLAAGLTVVLPTLLLGRDVPEVALPGRRGTWPAVILIIGLAAVAGAAVQSARPAAAATSKRTLRLLTYNIQQGYSEAGQRNFDGQLALIRQVNADVIGLQESDTNRIAGGNADVVRTFADGLDMYAYYGPKTVPGTFGIALLSRYPIENPRTFYMYSEGEQTATIAAQITVGGKRFNLFVTHLGNGGPIVQQEAILQEVTGKTNVVVMGDFNFRPDSAQYQLTRQSLDDAWLLKWPDGMDDAGLNPTDRIDHVFVSPGTAVRDAQYLISPASDHPAVVIEIEW
ncbi:MAG: endonuclease/exonuclease/phosphatase family protein [Anaerolineae bacterium]